MINRYGIECEFLFMPQTRIVPADSVFCEDLTSYIGTDGITPIGEVRTPVSSYINASLNDAIELLCQANNTEDIILQHPDYQLGLHFNFNCDHNDVNTDNIAELTELFYGSIKLYDTYRRSRDYGHPDNAIRYKEFGIEFRMFPAKFIRMQNLNYLLGAIQYIIIAKRDSHYENIIKFLKQLCDKLVVEEYIMRYSYSIVSFYKRAIIDKQFNISLPDTATILYTPMPRHKNLPEIYIHLPSIGDEEKLKNEFINAGFNMDWNNEILYNQAQVVYDLLYNDSAMNTIHSILSPYINKIKEVPDITDSDAEELKEYTDKLTIPKTTYLSNTIK